MKKKFFVLVFTLLMFFGCSNVNINTLTLQEIVNESLENKSKTTNTNNVGYKYYLPSGFNVSNNSGFVQELLSNNTKYYLNVDIISYFYENSITTTHEIDDYEYYEFEHDNKKGYLRITKNNDNFFVELCYNYAIIEVEVEESELRYAVSRGMMILSSINYNNLVIDKYINENNLESSETIYNIPEPENKNDNKNILEYIEEYDEEE